MKTFNFDFMRWRKIAGVASGVVVIGSVLALGVAGLNFGLDFTGGTLVEIGYPEAVAPERVRLIADETGPRYLPALFVGLLVYGVIGLFALVRQLLRRAR